MLGIRGGDRIRNPLLAHPSQRLLNVFLATVNPSGEKW